MKKIAPGVFYKTDYHGVNLGAVVYSRGLLLIDTPLLPEDGHSWISEQRKIATGSERYVVNLDSHPDRVLGNHMTDSMIISHVDVLETFRQRPAIFKTTNPDTGSEWESCSGLTGIRWQNPEIAFSDQMILQGGNLEIQLIHQPGPDRGSSWVVIPDKKVVFVGDAVVVKQPPFLSNANLPLWIESLDLLLTKFSDFKIVSSRSGLVNEKHIRAMRKMIVDINKRMERLGKRKGKPEETLKMVAKLLANTDAPAKYKNYYTQRLQHGLFHYYSRNYFPKSADK